MPETFEKYFTKTPEKPKSPEEIKEEKALGLAKEIEEIKKRIEEKGKTIYFRRNENLLDTALQTTIYPLCGQRDHSI